MVTGFNALNMQQRRGSRHDNIDKASIRHCMNWGLLHPSILIVTIYSYAAHNLISSAAYTVINFINTKIPYTNPTTLHLYLVP